MKKAGTNSNMNYLLTSTNLSLTNSPFLFKTHTLIINLRFLPLQEA
ncbi:hypothetical protein SAMN05877842_12038 [Ureibacillus acetophenoni]|uniref:Uncharacterized protein n=1 Tax=Ureibacillus acetophenoni TaxID=614649 RepID=A0A285UUT1_9BACL|nr:hypothetical protein SAMN05877842_12038 [Ureibacillus acetophenoni]